MFAHLYVYKLEFMYVFYMYVYVGMCLYISKCISTVSYLLYYWLIRMSTQFLGRNRECYKFLRWFVNYKIYFSFCWNKASEVVLSGRFLHCCEKPEIPASGWAGMVGALHSSGSKIILGSCPAQWAFLPAFLIRKLKAGCCLSLGSLVKVNMGLEAGWALMRLCSHSE